MTFRCNTTTPEGSHVCSKIEQIRPTSERSHVNNSSKNQPFRPIFALIFSLQIIILLTLSSCANEKQDKLLGVWECILPKEMPEPPSSSNWGYHFISPDTLEMLPGFFRYYLDKSSKNNCLEYFGSMVSYHIRRGNLEFISPRTGENIAKKIVSISDDTLVLSQGPGNFEKFVRIQRGDTSFQFDKVVLSTFGCGWRCPFSNISISKSGELIYFGGRYTISQGFYKTRLDPVTTQQVFRRFKIARIGNLMSFYERDGYDFELINAAFYSRNEIKKVIFDYGEAGPSPFLWACELLRWLPDNLSMEKIPVDSSRWAITRDSIFGPTDQSPW